MTQRGGDFSMTNKTSEYDSMRDEFNRGYVQVYTGNGKGKTTAAVGLAVRALGAGLNVYFGQFIKAGRYSEIKKKKKLKGHLCCRQYGRGCFLMRQPEAEDILLARKGLDEAIEAMGSGKYQLVIMDEINVACSLGLLDAADLIRLIEKRPEYVELVLTGRGALPEVIEKADLVTEMREIKHYYQKGVRARKGIES